MREIREGLAANLDTIPDLQVSAYQLSSPTLPCAYVMPSTVAYLAMGPIATRLSEMTFAVRVLVAAGTDQGGQIALDDLVSSGVVPAAIEADKTLGGVVQGLRVDGMTAYDAVVIGDSQEGFRAEWSVTVFV